MLVVRNKQTSSNPQEGLWREGMIFWQSIDAEQYTSGI
jgi:hypothetical protein